MKKTTLLLMILTFICSLFAFSACKNTNGDNTPYKIDVPNERITAELSSAYDIPTYDVLNKEGLILADFSATVSSVVGPDGETIEVAYNKINVTKAGVYIITYTAGEGITATVEIEFADRTAPLVNMAEDALPTYYIAGFEYSLPSYSITNGPDLEKCNVKVYYRAEGATEKTEVTLENSKFTVTENSGNYIIIIHVEDTVGNAKDYEYTVEATGPSEIVDGKILYFDEPFGVSQVKNFWNAWTLSYSSDVAYGDETGSMKVTAETESGDYIILDKLLESDVSNYTHLVIRVYNANDYDALSGYCWFGDTLLKANEWTEIKIPVGWLDTQNVSHPSVEGIEISSENIRNLSLRLWKDGVANTIPAGSTFYFSAMYAIVGNSEPEEIIDNKLVYLDEEYGLDQVSLYWPSAHTLSYDTTVKYEGEKGALKITYNQEQEFAYLIIDHPWLTDVSSYDYISFNVYNPTENEFDVKFTWCGDHTIKANGWTQVKIAISYFEEGKVKSMNDEVMSASEISSLPICFTGSGFATGESFYISAIYACKQDLGELGYLPEYDGKYSIVDCGDETYMMHVANATAASFEDYCSKVIAKGFNCVSQRSEASNLFATFTGESEYVYVYYTNYNNEMRVMTGPVEALLLEDYSIVTQENVTPYIASIPQPSQGEGYIVRLPDGRFIIQDGGYEGDDRVYNTLRELVGDEEIVIAAWFISHPHEDHYPAFIDFIKNHANDSDVTVERVIHNYGHIEMLTTTTEGDPVSEASILVFYETLETYAPDIPVFKAHTGQIISFGSATVEILYTMEDIIPEAFSNTNDSSMVIRVEVAGNSIVFLNDTCYTSGPILHNLWGSYLKSDIVQIAHHGMWPSVESIYHDIAAELVLFPNLHKYLKNYLVDSRWVDVINAALSYAKDISVSGDKLVVLELPYVFENNKEEKIEYILNYTGREDYKGYDGYDMQDGDIAPFDKFVGDYISLSASHGTAEYTTEQKFGDEAGSLKLTVSKESEVYLTISLPYTTDISAYDYVVFRVYNPTDTDISVGVCWAGDTTCKAGEWTEIKIPVSNFDSGKIDALTGKDIPITNICGLVVRFISGFEANDVFYISAVKASKNEIVEEDVAENIAVKFDKDSDLSHVSVYWSTAHNIAIDTTTKHGNDAGSLKVTLLSNSDNYIILSTPYNTDFSAYDYISFWVYNSGSADFKMGTTWAADTICVAGQWTEVVITKEMFEASKVKDMSSVVLTMDDITKLPLRIFNTSGLAAGESFYISAVKAGKNEIAEEDVAENVAMKFETESDLNRVSVYWPTASSIALDTTMKHDDDAGSLKVTKVTTTYNYIILDKPFNTDFSSYDYISFWVYNAGSAAMSVGTNWCGGVSCAVGEWTEVIITKDMFEANEVKNMSETAVSMSNIAGFVLRVDYNQNLAAGECFYISAVKAGKNAETERTDESTSVTAVATNLEYAIGKNYGEDEL